MSFQLLLKVFHLCHHLFKSILPATSILSHLSDLVLDAVGFLDSLFIQIGHVFTLSTLQLDIQLEI